MIRTFILAAVATLSVTTGWGQDTSRAPLRGFLPLPIIYYTPETGIAGGAAVMYFFHNDVTSRPSTVSVTFIYTERKQIISELAAETYLQDNTYRIDGDLAYVLFPLKFFGLGNNTRGTDEEIYTSVTSRFYANLQKRITPDIKAGVGFYVERRSFSDLAPQGFIATHVVPGSAGGLISSFGILASYDTRDNIFSTYEGSYHQFSIKWFNRLFGSDYDYVRTSFDLRQFFLVGRANVIGWQALGIFANGNVPFYSMSQLGGQNMMRGYYEGKFRDHHYVAAQAEFRTPLWWQFDAAAFAGLGEVASSVAGFAIGELKPSVGVGIRFAFNPKERLKLRMDWAWGTNSSGLYVAASEAF